MEASGITPDVVSYNIVINLCAHTERPTEADGFVAKWKSNIILKKSENNMRTDEIADASTALVRSHLARKRVSGMPTLATEAVRQFSVTTLEMAETKFCSQLKPELLV